MIYYLINYSTINSFKKKFRRILSIFVYISLLSVITFAQTSVEHGVIDLTSHNFHSQPPIELTGDWLFFWNELIHPINIDSTKKSHYRPFTKLWNESSELNSNGAATYKAILYLPKDRPALALDIPDFYSSYRLYLNDKEIAHNGVPTTSKKSYTPNWLPKTISLGDLPSDTLEMVLHVANFHHKKGGAYQAIKIGSSEKLFNARYLEYGYAFVLTGALLMGGLFFFGLYLFGRHETTILYFSMFCIVYSYRIIGFGEYPLHFLLQEIPWIVTLKLEYITLFLSGYLFGIYTLNLYPKEVSKKLMYLLSSISLLFLAISLLLPASIFTHLVTPYFAVLIFYILYAFWVYAKAVVNESIGAQFALGSTGIVFVVFLYQILVYFEVLNEFLLLNFIGYLSFFFFQSLILSYRFAEFLKISKVQAEESSLAKSQFLSTMSHEIRTPLNAVIGLSGLLSDSNLSDKQKEYSQTIRQSGESLLSIINNILDYSKIESGKLELEESEFNLKELIETVFDLTSPINNKEDLELIYNLDESVPEFIVGDSTRLQQVLINLVANGIKFTSQGNIVINVSSVDTNLEFSTLKFQVKDTGIGIPENRLNRLFQSFSQVDASSTRKFGGTGLGLVISKKLVEAMGGSISVQSTPNKGSTFSFTIITGNSKRKKNAIPSPILHGKKVFILDDNLTNLNIFKLQLEKSGITVDTFNEPKDILNKVEKLNSYDFGILDLQMPDHDGIEVATEIRNHFNKKILPLVLLSSVHELEDESQRKIFNLYLTKPVKQTQLLNNLERIFSTNDQSKIEKVIEATSTSLLGTNISILIAEDNLINQKVATRILERLGLSADIAQDGQHAIQMVQTNKYDLIFMDMEMPVLDGLEATRKIKLIEKSLPQSPKIIAMTANALPGDKERCLEAGMDDFVSKPITVESVKTILKKWFRDF
tara:strand:+ start:10323 stop:13124 length:2802 start_codon:yes stop_codon:yes gene_type:complete